MRKAAILLVAAVMAFAGAAAVVGTAKAETEKELKYVSFRTQTETDWTSFSWGDAGAACTVEIPFSAFTPERLASYTPDENGKFDADQLAFVKIGIWSNSKEVVDVEFYLDSLKLHAENALDDGSEPVTPPTDPEEKGCKGCNSSLTAVGGAAAAVSALGAAAFMLVRRKRRER